MVHMAEKAMFRLANRAIPGLTHEQAIGAPLFRFGSGNFSVFQ